MNSEYERNNEIIDDRYKIIQTLGEGGMALVYKATDLITDKPVAIKMMRKETAQIKINLSRFEREARVAASLNHNNIVKIINVGTYQGLPYMVNEFINGQTLKQMLDIRGKFSTIEACDIMYQLCQAVYYAHQHGVIHRDIKSQNIFLSKDGIVKLGDFGIATFHNSNHVTRSEVVIGSVHYIAPEISQGAPANDRSDIYSLGITFFELLTGLVPFDNDSPVTIALMHIKNKFPNINRFNPNVSDNVANIIYKACAKNPLDRYDSANAMRLDIEELLKKPSLMEVKHNFLYKLFHRNKYKRDIENSDKSQTKILLEKEKELNKETDE